jgi:hypothetical protein
MRFMAISMTNDKLLFIPITLTTTAADGTVTTVPVPATDTFTVVSSNPASLGASFGPNPDPAGPAGNGAIGTPLVMESDSTNGGGGFTLTVTDSAGDIQFVSDLISISLVAVPNTITGGTPVVTAANPTIPTAPGP